MQTIDKEKSTLSSLLMEKPNAVSVPLADGTESAFTEPIISLAESPSSKR